MGRKQVWEQPTPFPQVKLVRFSDKKYIMVRIYDPSVQKASYRSTGTVDETKAMALVPEIYQEFLKAPHAYRKDHRITTLQLIDRYIDHCWSRHQQKEIAWNTANAKVNTFKTGLVPYVVECGLSRLSEINGTTSFKGYAKWRRANGYAPSTVTFEVKCIKEWVNWAFKAGYLKSDKCVIEVPRVAISARDTSLDDGHAFSDEEAIEIGQEFERRIKAASGQEKYKLTMVFNYFNLMIDSGLRTSECYHLEFRDLMTRKTENFLSQQVLVKVRISKTGYRETVITSMVPTIQKKLLMEHGYPVSPESRLWTNPRTGKPYSISTIREAFRDVLKTLGLESNHRLYDARATYITERLLNGGPQLSTYLLAKAVGNSESQIRATYENILMRQAAEKLVQRGDDSDGSTPEFESMV